MKKEHTLKRSIIFTFILYLIPFILILIAANISFQHILKKQIIKQTTTALHYDVAKIDEELTNIQNYISRFDTEKVQLNELESSNTNSVFYARQALYNELCADITFFPHIDALFLYSEASHEYISASPNDISPAYQKSIQQYVENDMSENQWSWNFLMLDSQQYLSYIYKTAAYRIGAFINLQRYENLSLKTSESSYSFSNKASALYTSPLNFYHNIILSEESQLANLIVWYTLPEKDILGSMTQFRILLFIFMALAIVPFSLYVFSLYHQIQTPLKSIKKAICQMQPTNLDVKITDTFSIQEFHEIKEAFNAMTAEISALKKKIINDTIHYQQKELQYQKTELDYLRMQIRPHFFLNALTTISNFAHLGQLENMSSFIDYLSQHIRFMFRSNLSSVSLQDELTHIENYIHLQNCRFNDRICYIPECEPDLMDCFVPAFSIYTFVENSIKHTATYDSFTDIFISVSKTEWKSGPHLKIIIEDNGKGFSDEFLKTYNSSSLTHSSDGTHIGIYNIIRVLEIMYEADSHISFSNSITHGARICIMLPILHSKES